MSLTESHLDTTSEMWEDQLQTTIHEVLHALGFT